MIEQQIILTSLIVILTFFILRHYFIFYWCFMYDIPKIWNAKIEKPRLANLSLSYCLTCLSAWILISNNISGRLDVFITIVLILFFGLFYTMSLIIILSPLVNFSKKIQELTSGLFQDKFESLLASNPDKVDEFYIHFNNEYFLTNTEDFHSLIHLLPLKSKNKITWLYSGGKYKEKNKTNKKALYHFIGEIFSTEDKTFMEKVIVNYFQDSDGTSYTENNLSNTHSKWNTSNPVHLKEMSKKIRKFTNK